MFEGLAHGTATRAFLPEFREGTLLIATNPLLRTLAFDLVGPAVAADVGDRPQPHERARQGCEGRAAAGLPRRPR